MVERAVLIPTSKFYTNWSYGVLIITSTQPAANTPKQYITIDHMIYFAFYPNQNGAGNCLTIKKKVRPLQYSDATESRSRFRSIIKII